MTTALEVARKAAEVARIMHRTMGAWPTPVCEDIVALDDALTTALRRIVELGVLLREAELPVAEREYIDANHTFSYGSGGAEPSPAEWGISAGYQQTASAGPKDQFDEAVAAYHKQNAEESDSAEHLSLANRIKAALAAPQEKEEQ